MLQPNVLIFGRWKWGAAVLHATDTRINSRGLRPRRAVVLFFPAFSWMMGHRERKETQTLRDFTVVEFEDDAFMCVSDFFLGDRWLFYFPKEK